MFRIIVRVNDITPIEVFVVSKYYELKENERILETIHNGKQIELRMKHWIKYLNEIRDILKLGE